MSDELQSAAAIREALARLNAAENDLARLGVEGVIRVIDEVLGPNWEGGSNGQPDHGRAEERETERALFTAFPDYHRTLDDVVVEPPLNGRPAGYRLGDVGQFQLSANVEPREVSAHEAVAINLTLMGIGNLPQKLELPEIKDVEWLEPTTTESTERKGGKIGGKRTWQYVVKVDEPGEVKLGKVRFPYWDPERSRYEVAAVDLGQLRVKPSTTAEPEPAASASKTAPSLSLVARDQLGDVPPPPRYWADLRHFWLFVFLGPLGTIASFGLKSLGTMIGAKIGARRSSAKRRTQEQLAACRQILASGDAPAAASGLERALVLAIESATTLRARGIVRGELASHRFRQSGGSCAASLAGVRD